jgi:phosphohistidine phosphatase
MRKLILIRHATAEHERYPKKDIDRDLDETGVAEAIELGKYMRLQKDLPERVFCSSANRTHQTARIFLKEAGLEESILETLPKLYNAGYQTLLNQIEKAEEELECIAIVGHNPGISQLATALSGDLVYQLAPGSSVCLEFQCSSWPGISVGDGQEIWYFTP